MKNSYLLYIISPQLSISSNKMLVGSFLQTLGIKINIYLQNIDKNKTCLLSQINVKGEEVTNCKFITHINNKNFFQLNKVQNTQNINLFCKINIKRNTKSEIVYEQVDNLNEDGKKTIKNFSTINLYGSLNTISNLQILESYIPDYDKLSLPKKEESATRYFNELYYRLSGLNKKSTELMYINDSRNYTMGNILGVLGTPIFIFPSGNGEDTFLYLGSHECEGKRLVGFMLIQFDIFGKVVKYFHHIPLCKKCHIDYSIKEFSIIENKLEK